MRAGPKFSVTGVLMRRGQRHHDTERIAACKDGDRD